jgi:3-hydroxyacyl-[acyl-carrier-protein] dehydratase
MAEPDLTALGLPHRPPFVFVRRLVRCQPGESAQCLTSFSAADPIFAGHFPGNPMVPGVILTEALAQTAGIAAASGFAEEVRPFFLLSAIQKMKFLEPARPEEEILLKAERAGRMDDLWQFAVRAEIAGRLIAEGQLVLNRTAKSSAPELE